MFVLLVQNFAYSEMLENDKSAKVMKKLTDRMTKAEKKSEVCHG